MLEIKGAYPSILVSVGTETPFSTIAVAIAVFAVLILVKSVDILMFVSCPYIAESSVARFSIAAKSA